MPGFDSFLGEDLNKGWVGGEAQHPLRGGNYSKPWVLKAQALAEQ